MPAGRPTDYRPEYAGIAKGAYGMGATDVQVAAILDTTVQTLHSWSAKYPEFLEARKIAKDAADDLVERSLFEKALSGDTTAMIFWLKNRRRGEWRDRVDMNHTGTLGQMTDKQVEERFAELQAKIAARNEIKT